MKQQHSTKPDDLTIHDIFFFEEETIHDIWLVLL